MDKCLVRVAFPTVMKMEFGSDFSIPSSSTLQETKQKVFDAFWGSMGVFAGQHGTPDMVKLIDRDTN